MSHTRTAQTVGKSVPLPLIVLGILGLSLLGSDGCLSVVVTAFAPVVVLPRARNVQPAPVSWHNPPFHHSVQDSSSSTSTTAVVWALGNGGDQEETTVPVLSESDQAIVGIVGTLASFFFFYS